MGKKDGKPRGKMSAYAYFVQTCRDELKKKNPNESVVFAEFSRKCGEKWKAMSGKDKKRFEDMAAKDKVRFDKEMANYKPPAGGGAGGKGKGKRKKDPNAPKRALSAFFCFCNEERPKVKAKHPNYTVADIAKELGKRWEACSNRTKYDQLAAKDRQRYEREMASYKGGSGGAAKKAGGKAAAAAKKPAKKPADDDEDDDDEDEEDEEEEEDEDSD